MQSLERLLAFVNTTMGGFEKIFKGNDMLDVVTYQI